MFQLPELGTCELLFLQDVCGPGDARAGGI